MAPVDDGKPDTELIGIARRNLREQQEGQQRLQRARYIRQGHGAELHPVLKIEAAK